MENFSPFVKNFLEQLKRAKVPPEELVQFYVVCIHINKVHYSDTLSRWGLVQLHQRGTELCKKIFFNKIVENSLDVLHPLITFNELPSKDLCQEFQNIPCKAMQDQQVPWYIY